MSVPNVVKGPIGDLQTSFSDKSGAVRAPNIYDWPVLQLGRTSSGLLVPIAVGSDGSVSTTPTPTSSALTDRSGTITSGGSAQTIAAANASRKYLLFQNNSDIDMWINFGVTAVANQPSIKIVAGGYYENPAHFCPSGLVSVIGATTGKTFTCKEA